MPVAPAFPAGATQVERRRGGLRAYRAILTLPGVGAFTLAGIAARLPMATITLATLLLVERATGSFLQAALVTATSGVANTVATPLLARRVDRRGQAAVLRPTALLHALGVLALVGLVLTGTPAWTWYVAALVSGAMCPAAGTLIRSRWGHLLRERSGLLQTAFAWESALDQLMFLLGPVLVGLCAALLSPALALVAGALSTVAGSFWLATQSATAPRPEPAGADHPRVLTRPVLLLATVLAAVGALCGSIAVLVSAEARELGIQAATGPMLGLWATGSLVAGLAYGTVRWRRPLAQRFLVAVTLFALAATPLAMAGSAWQLGLSLLLCGATVSPVLITAYALVAALVPSGARTQGMAWVGSGLSISGAAAAAGAGMLVELAGVQVAFGVAVLSGPAALTAAVVVHLLCRRSGHAVADVAATLARLPRQRTPESVGIAA